MGVGAGMLYFVWLRDVWGGLVGVGGGGDRNYEKGNVV